jgi:hypothetical protein
VTLPIVRDRKWIKKALLFEPKASFKAFPFFVLHNWEPEGQWRLRRLLLLTFLGEARKVSGRRATPDQRSTNLAQKIKKYEVKPNHLAIRPRQHPTQRQRSSFP